MTTSITTTDDRVRSDLPAHGPRGLVDLDPRVALQVSTWDSFALWAVYLMRKAALPMILLSGIVMSLIGRDGESLEGVNTFGEYLDAIQSPLVLLVAAVGLRLGAALLAFILAYPLSHSATIVVEQHRGWQGAWGRWMDRFHVTRAYRSLRWTKAVREVAATRLGRASVVAHIIERSLGWSLPVLAVGSLVAHAAAA